MIFKLDKIIDKLGVTRNKLAILADVRPNTINDLTNGSTKRIEIETLEKLLKALNDLSSIRGLGITFNVQDIFEFELEEDFQIQDSFLAYNTYSRIKKALFERVVLTNITGLEKTNLLELITLFENNIHNGVYQSLDRTSDRHLKQINTILYKERELLLTYGLVELQDGMYSGSYFKFSARGIKFMTMLKKN